MELTQVPETTHQKLEKRSFALTVAAHSGRSIHAIARCNVARVVGSACIVVVARFGLKRAADRSVRTRPNLAVGIGTSWTNACLASWGSARAEAQTCCPTKITLRTQNLT